MVNFAILTSRRKQVSLVYPELPEHPIGVLLLQVDVFGDLRQVQVQLTTFEALGYVLHNLTDHNNLDCLRNKNLLGKTSFIQQTPNAHLGSLWALNQNKLELYVLHPADCNNDRMFNI